MTSAFTTLAALTVLALAVTGANAGCLTPQQQLKLAENYYDEAVNVYDEPPKKCACIRDAGKAFHGPRCMRKDDVEMAMVFAIGGCIDSNRQLVQDKPSNTLPTVEKRAAPQQESRRAVSAVDLFPTSRGVCGASGFCCPMSGQAKVNCCRLYCGGSCDC